MKVNVVVVIPYYHSELTECEKISFQSCLTMLRNYPIVLVVPEKMTLERCPKEDHLLYEVVPDSWLASVESYNQMMLAKEFYARFMKYEYMLVFQLDAFVFSDSLEWFCNLGYDYIGAPWLRGWKLLRDLDHGVWHVGNGGFSLRKISAFMNIFDTQSVQNVKVLEDLFWASRDSEEFRVAPLEIALRFSFEQDVRQCYLLNHNRLPFGCHAWEKYDFNFWRPIFEERGYVLATRVSEGADQHNHYLKPRCHYLEAEPGVVQFCLKSLSGLEECFTYVFGARVYGAECIWLLRHSHMHDIGCIDNNCEIWGSTIWDIKIESPVILENTGNKSILILIAAGTIKAQNEILCQLETLGYQYGRNVFFYSDLIRKICE